MTISRNALCLCGSGKKFKRCCGEKSLPQQDMLLSLLQKGIQYHQAGNGRLAEQHYRRALDLSPENSDALNLLGVICHGKGELDTALDLISRAVECHGDEPGYWNNLGGVFQDMGRLDEAAAAYVKALGLNPAYAEARNNLGTVLQRQGDLEEARACYEQAMRYNPAYPDALNNLGNLHVELGRYDVAIGLFRRAIDLRHDYFEAYNNLGAALRAAGVPGEAIRAFRNAIGVNSRVPEIHLNLSKALRDIGELSAALGACNEALRLNPNYDEAYGEKILLQLYLCAWEGLETNIAKVRNLVISSPKSRIPPFMFLGLPASAEEQQQCAHNWAENNYGLFRKMRERFDFAHGRRAIRGKLRVGYLSADFHSHATAYLMAELFELHDRSNFEILGYSLGRDDGSPMHARLKQGFDRFVDVSGVGVVEVAKQIYSDGVDILVDLKGYTQHAQPGILALRPAPIQVNYLGYPGTMGADFIDYIIADPFVIPSAQSGFYSEKIIYLPECYQVNDRKKKIGPVPTREECGLPKSGVVFCCFNQAYKIMPSVFEVWMRLLTSVPDSVLWLLELTDETTHNLREECTSHGVEASRLIFAPRRSQPDHLARMQLADIFLDTWPYNAHTLASDALWVGLPLVTYAGDTFASRVAGSLLHAMNMDELITYSLDEYETVARELASNPGKLSAVKDKQTRNKSTSPLFMTEQWTRYLEQAYFQMWDRYVCACTH